MCSVAVVCALARYGLAVVEQELHSWLESMFLFALVWGIGGHLDTEGRRKFDSWLRFSLSGDIPLETVVRRRKIAVPIPNSGSVFDFKFDNQVCCRACCQGAVHSAYATPTAVHACVALR
jgi:hypothetical protein